MKDHQDAKVPISGMGSNTKNFTIEKFKSIERSRRAGWQNQIGQASVETLSTAQEKPACLMWQGSVIGACNSCEDVRMCPTSFHSVKAARSRSQRIPKRRVKSKSRTLAKSDGPRTCRKPGHVCFGSKPRCTRVCNGPADKPIRSLTAIVFDDKIDAVAVSSVVGGIFPIGEARTITGLDALAPSSASSVLCTCSRVVAAFDLKHWFAISETLWGRRRNVMC